MAEGKPLSLNERNERLLIDLSRSRGRPADPNPRHHPEVRVGKVKVEGRRRLCKVVSYSPAAAEDDDDGPGEQCLVSPPREQDGGNGGGGESIRDILDDLSSRLETLSVEKPRPRPRPATQREPEPLVEFESASSSLSSPSPVSSSEEEIKKWAETEKREGLVKPLVYEEEEEEEESVVLERNGEQQEVKERAETKKREGSKGKALKPTVSEEEEECVVLGSDEEQQEVDRRTHTKKKVEAKGNLVKPLLSKEKNCVVLGSDRKPQQLKGKESGHGSFGVWGNDSVEDLSDDDQNDEGEHFTMAGTGSCKSRTYNLPEKIAKILYPHQRDGLKWLWVLHCRGMGGILGDDMGLGKTMQVSAFLAGLFHSHLIKRVLIVAPKTLIPHWMKELSIVGLNMKIRDYSGANAKIRQYELQYVLQEGGILLTTYDIVRNNWKSIRGDSYTDGDGSEEGILWDYTVLDEGHIIKNPKTQRAQSLFEIPSAHRVIITGTPIQNNLKELWALFYFCCPEILGDKDMFKIRYENPILRGNDKNASDRDKQIGSTVAKELRERIKPYFLRRLKSEVFLEDDATKNAKLSKKNEIIVWLRLTPCQRQLYEAFLKSELVYSSIKGSPLAALTILKKICDHPLLLTKKAAEGVLEGMDTMLNREELSMVEEMAMNLANTSQRDGVLQVDHNVSCKISFIMSLMKNLVEEGHIILIFSQTRKMLNLIQEEIISEGYKFLRIDGTTKVSEREKIVKDFQEGSGAPIFLLTSQVGGLGLTLTKADRVIVVDPAWNPSTDNQSVDRAYRIGQKKDVLVYRLMTCGTVEEKIYKMQVFKGGLFRTATEQKEQTRYFSQKDIRELFSLPEQGFDVSLTQQQLHEEHDRQHTMDDSLMNHIKFLHQQGIAGVSNHSLLFSKTAVVPFVRKNTEVPSHMGDRILRSSPSGSCLERVVNGAEYALNPKDQKFTSRTYSPRTSPNDGKDSPENIEERIRRLSQTLEDKGLVLKLPDRGERILKQISELNQQLSTIRGSTHGNSSEKKEPEVINIDDLTEGMQNKLYV